MATIDRRGANVSAADPPISTNPNPDLAIKAPARVATTGSNIPLSGLITLDGVTLAAGDRVLAKDQTDARTNGLYNAQTGPWTRTIDAANNSQWTTGTLVTVISGSSNAGKIYGLGTVNPITLGTSNLIFAPPPTFAFGAARMFPNQNQGSGPWAVFDPWGNAINTSGTTTQGLQEAIDVATANKWPLLVYGTGTIIASAPITIPTTFLGHIVISNEVNVSFSALGSAALIVIDSQENSHIRLLCEVVQHAGDTGPVIDIAPATADQIGNTVIAASLLEFMTIAPASGGIGIRIDPTNGSIIGNEIYIRDINGGATGIQILNPGNAFRVVEHNKFFIGYIHGQTSRVVQVGNSSSNQANIRANAWYASRVDPNGTLIAWEHWGRFDTIVGLAITNETTTAANGLAFQSGANSNTVVGGSILATTPVVDNGSGNAYFNVNGFAGSGLVPVQAGGVTAGHVALWNATGVLQDGGAPSGNVIGPASSIAGDIATFADTTGKVLQDTAVTGTGAIVRASSPNLTSPSLGAAIAATINRVALTAPATGSTLTIADGKVLAANNSITVAGTDGKTETFNNSLTFGGTDGKSLTLTNALTVTTNDGTLSFGTAAATITFQGTDTYVGRTTNDTLTNKTLTSPIIVGGAIDNAVVGGTTPAAGTFTTLLARAGNGTSNVRIAGQITAQLTVTGTGVDTTEDILQTFTLPANTLDAVGRSLRIRAWGTFGANTNIKTIRLYFGSKIYDSTALAQNGTGWILEAEVYKTGSNTQTSWATILAGFSDPGAEINAPNQTDTAPIVIKVTGQNGTASANDTVCNGMSVLIIN
ncbi:MAG TPA: hypothetical protein VKC66_20725 [Xanthobacteraceae bacterium]|nr:hypothetical protein [Xanthobacteraceae bacterium]